MEYRILYSKVVKAPIGGHIDSGIYRLSAFDQLACYIPITRAVFFKSFRFDEDALMRSIEIVLQDLPYLSGRYTPMTNSRFSSVHIQLNNEGAMYTVVEAPEILVESLGPHTWVQRNVTKLQHPSPFYTDSFEASQLLNGKEALLKIRLTHLKDGDVLCINVSHALLDDMWMSELIKHIATRYKQVKYGEPPELSNILQYQDRTNLIYSEAETGTIYQHVKQSWFLNVFNSISMVFRTAWSWLNMLIEKRDLHILHIPIGGLNKLKEKVNRSRRGSNARMGDIVQALGAMLFCAAVDKPAYPAQPKFQCVLAQRNGIQQGYVGNTHVRLEVSSQEEHKPHRFEDDQQVLEALSQQIRIATIDHKTNKERQKKFLALCKKVISIPWYFMLTMYEHHEDMTIQTNYVPTWKLQEINFGKNGTPLFMRGIGWADPLQAWIRPAQHPYSEGFFVYLSLTKEQQRRLKEHSILHLMPGISFIEEKL